jgi:hypothetical protein
MYLCDACILNRVHTYPHTKVEKKWAADFIDRTFTALHEIDQQVSLSLSLSLSYSLSLTYSRSLSFCECVDTYERYDSASVCIHTYV